MSSFCYEKKKKKEMLVIDCYVNSIKLFLFLLICEKLRMFTTCFMFMIQTILYPHPSPVTSSEHLLLTV